MTQSMAHSHGKGLILSTEQADILASGLSKLLEMTAGLEFKPFESKKFVLPLSNVPYPTVPSAAEVRSDVEKGMKNDLIRILEKALALLELYAVNQPGTVSEVLADMDFVATAFSSKRANGWIAVLGDADVDELEEAINSRWQFMFFRAPNAHAGLYLLLNALSRYAFVYGKAPVGDAHAVGHFVEDHTPGLLLCRGTMSNLDMTLALMAMKMGVPAIVPKDFPFPFGKTLRIHSLAKMVEAVVGFPNIRRLISLPEIPQFPEYTDPEHENEEIESKIVWGDTPQSFYVVAKGTVRESSVEVRAKPSGQNSPMGIVVTVDAAPMDAFDRRYIERRIAGSVAMIKGAGFEFEEGRLVVKQAAGADVQPEKIGEVLLAAVRHYFPRITRARVEIIFDETELSALKPEIDAQIEARSGEVASATEETVEHFYSCVGCSQFAPDHVCIVTPERQPMCGRAYELIKTGALYGYDDMSNIHHSAMYRELNSFGVFEKGECLDSACGEWSGANLQIAGLSQGRTDRVFLHSIDDFPHTGCGCFGLIIFRMAQPKGGIGIMARGEESRTPDGRTWEDLYYNQTGKQTPGSTGATTAYLRSRKFLQGHGGWKSVTWVSSKVAEMMGSDLPDHVEVGDAMGAGG